MEIYMERPTRGRRQVQMQLERQYALHMSLGSAHRYMSIMKLNSLRKKRYIAQKKEAQNSHLPYFFRSLCRCIAYPTEIS